MRLLHASNPLRRLRPLAAIAATTALAASIALTSATAARAGEQPAEPDGPSYGAPTVGECHKYGWKVFLSDTDTSPAVPCSAVHTAYVHKVAYLPSGLAWSTTDDAAFMEKIYNKVVPGCMKSVRKTLDAPWAKVSKTAYAGAFYFPTEDQIAHGARWIRCDLILFGGKSSLLNLPTVKPALGKITTSERGCIVVRKGTGYLTGCTQTHHYRAASTHRMPGSAYPAEKKFQRFARTHCPQKRAWWARLSSRTDWKAGNHNVQCYVAGR
ncbi:hypothetical protein E8D34_00815 [Nocardioides sp. GY 10113]|uniref:septum formation family protein n=1 Tax=Nocardioides sp. GY 10113 TaxID=2569761 RepID=UPI0010A86982|nr:septum formation family protein [Nocardioides sp. GY 10113]TIC89082.1 hypothetical protein E8D34_00815 [Nocardioides sp. GY 10113]